MGLGLSTRVRDLASPMNHGVDATTKIAMGSIANSRGHWSSPKATVAIKNSPDGARSFNIRSTTYSPRLRFVRQYPVGGYQVQLRSRARRLIRLRPLAHWRVLPKAKLRCRCSASKNPLSVPQDACQGRCRKGYGTNIVTVRSSLALWG
ncbi:hypothetical protein BASA60_000631 [Batrachochytrium salamandrivorans]|nr:hypothetical protein BASA60_000631 [Batrachochytrium salamandrivorans]